MLFLGEHVLTANGNQLMRFEHTRKKKNNNPESLEGIEEGEDDPEPKEEGKKNR